MFHDSEFCSKLIHYKYYCSEFLRNCDAKYKIDGFRKCSWKMKTTKFELKFNLNINFDTIKAYMILCLYVPFRYSDEIQIK